MSKIKLTLDVADNLRNLADSIEALAGAIEGNEAKSKQVTLEEVRAVLAKKSQSDKQAEVKELITKYGAKKLSDIPKEKYPDLLKDAEDI